MDAASARRLVVAAVGFHHAALAVFVSQSDPIGERVIGSILITAFRSRFEISVNSEELLAAAAESRVGVINLAGRHHEMLDEELAPRNKVFGSDVMVCVLIFCLCNSFRGSRLVRNLGLDEFPQQGQRFLPAEIASLGRNHCGHAFLRDVQLGSAEYLLQADRDLHFSGQVWVVELVRVPDAFGGLQFEVGSAEGVALASAEISE